MQSARGPVVRFVADYRERHCYMPNAILHAIGIPLTLGAIYLAWRGRWIAAAAALVSGYALQTLGHALQGSEVGELMFIGRLLGKRRPSKSL